MPKPITQIEEKKISFSEGLKIVRSIQKKVEASKPITPALERFRDKFISKWAFDHNKPLWKNDVPSPKEMGAFLTEELIRVRQEGFKEGSAYKGEAVRKAYMQGCRETLEEVEQLFRYTFVTTDVYLVDRFLKKLSQLKSKKAGV